MICLSSIINLFPLDIRCRLETEIANLDGAPEEIRIRIGYPVCLRYCGCERFFGEPITKNQLIWIVGNAADGSYHTAVRYLRMGYIPLQFGSRMGVCGNGVRGEISSFDDISSVCIRIARSVTGCGNDLYEKLYGEGFRSTLIIAQPGMGKTTLLRELIRKLSYAGLYVGVADERSEISGMYRDKPSFDLGPRTDVLSGISKRKSAVMLLKSMTPDVIAMDEITAYNDSEAIMEIAGCGAGLLATIHGEDFSVFSKPGLKMILDAGVFHYGILIRVQEGARMYKAVNLHDENVWSGDYFGSRGDAGRSSFVGDAEKDECIGRICR